MNRRKTHFIQVVAQKYKPRLLKLCLVVVLLSCASVTALAQSTAVSAAEESVPVLMLSDIHFDPLHDPEKVGRLATAPWQRWTEILTEAPSQNQQESFSAIQAACGARGVDTDIALLNASLRGAHEYAGKAKFVTVTGDLLVHGFECRYQFATHGATGYPAFAEKTAIYVMQSVEAAFPGLPVYFALGNNDSSCGDYRLDQHDRFLRATSDSVIPGIRAISPAEKKRAREQYEASGHYSVALTLPRRTRLLVLSDDYLSAKYATCAGNKDQASAEAEIGWLDRELNSAKEHGEKVWVMGHIPPGVDIYSTLRPMKDVCDGGKVIPFLGSNQLAEVLVRHADIVRLGLFAHTHSDEVRLLSGDDGQAAKVPVKLVSSISPVNGNTPTFTIAQVNAVSATLEDYTVYKASNVTGIDTTWSREYSFRETYHEPDLSANSLADMINQFHSDASGEKPVSRAYQTYFAPGMPPLLALVWPKYACALDHLTEDGFESCVCSSGR